MDIKIFVEGKEDKEFLEQYLKFLKYPDTEIIICKTNKINENIISKIKEFKDNDQKVLFIFDADSDFVSTQNRLKKESKDLLQNEDIFLFPNNSKAGELETLLFDAAKEKKIYECFQKYKECIKKYNESYSKKIHKKSIRYAYFEALGLSLSNNDKDVQKRKESYINIFDFDSQVFCPLKQFLKKYFNN